MRISSTRNWSHKMDRWTNSPPVVGKGQDIFVSGIQHQVKSLDLTSGKVKWQSEAGESLYSSPRLTDTGSLLIESSSDSDGYRFIALDEQTGRVRWSRDIEGYSDLTQIHGETLYSKDDASFSAVDLNTGQNRWSIKCQEGRSGQAFIGPQGRVYLERRDPGTGLNMLRQLNPKTGTIRWETISDSNSFVPAPSGHLGVVHAKYNSDYSFKANHFELRSPETGEKVWQVDRSQQDYNFHFTGDSRVISILRDSQERDPKFHTVESRDLESGELQWTTQLPPVRRSFTDDSGQTYCQTTKQGEQGYYGHSLTALCAHDGRALWTFTPEVDRWQDTELGATSLYVVGRRDIEGSQDRFRSHLFSVDKTTGQEKWQRDLGSTPRQFIEDQERQRLYVRVGQSQLLCLDSETGECLWHHQSASQIEVSQQLTADGRIVMTDLDGLVSTLSDNSELVKPGSPPADPDRDYGMPVATRGYSSDYIQETERPIFGKATPVLATDHNGKAEDKEWESIFIRDANGDGKYNNLDLEQLPDLSYLRSLDQDRNGFLSGEEIDSIGLTRWRDSNSDGQIDEDDYVATRDEQRFIDLERLHEMRRFS